MAIYSDVINQMMGRTEKVLKDLERKSTSAVLNTRYPKSSGGGDVDFYETTQSGALIRIETLSFTKEYLSKIKKMFVKNICTDVNSIKTIIKLKREQLAQI